MLIVNILSALLTPIIAIIAVYIAYQQYAVNKRRFKKELYEKRLDILKIITTYIESIKTSTRIDLAKVVEFKTMCMESRFIFEKEIPNFIEELYQKGIFLHSLGEKLYGNEKLPVGNERSLIAEQKTGVIKWFIAESKELDKRFQKYLDLS